MSEIKNGGLDQYGAGPFKQQQFGTDGVEGVKPLHYELRANSIQFALSAESIIPSCSGLHGLGCRLPFCTRKEISWKKRLWNVA